MIDTAPEYWTPKLCLPSPIFHLTALITRACMFGSRPLIRAGDMYGVYSVIYRVVCSLSSLYNHTSSLYISCQNIITNNYKSISSPYYCITPCIITIVNDPLFVHTLISTTVIHTRHPKQTHVSDKTLTCFSVVQLFPPPVRQYEWRVSMSWTWMCRIYHIGMLHVHVYVTHTSVLATLRHP